MEEFCWHDADTWFSQPLAYVSPMVDIEDWVSQASMFVGSDYVHSWNTSCAGGSGDGEQREESVSNNK